MNGLAGGARYDDALGAAGAFDRSAIYLFSVAFAALVFVADVTNVVGLSPYSVAIKYAYTATVLALTYHYFSRFACVSTASAAPLLALAFFLATGLSYVANLRRGIEVSYITAFTASLIFAVATFIPPGRFTINAPRMCRTLLRLFLLGSVCYLLEAALKRAGAITSLSFAADIEHVKSIVCVIGLSLSILTRAHRYSLAFLAIIAASLAVRPSSTLLVASVICVPLSLALRTGRARTYKAIAWGALGLAAATPWLFYFFFDQIAEIATYSEGYIKEDLLEGHSNTEFRLEIFRLAVRSLDSSLPFGQALSGNPNVDLGAQWPWWHDVVPDGTALIHSDWLVIVSQAGLIGAALFFLMFASALKLRLRALAVVAEQANPEVTALLSISIVGCVAFFLYSSFNPMLPLYHVAHIFWLVMLVSEIAGKNIIAAAGSRMSPAMAIASPRVA
jgi:hypothetical protein